MDGSTEVDFRLMEGTGPDSGFRAFARRQYDHVIDAINFNMELCRKNSDEIERLQRAATDESRRMALATEIERLTGDTKAASEQLPVLEYRIAHADDCARVYLETARKSALTVSESSLVQLCRSGDLYPPQK
jgi:hypothetical protein